MVTIHVTRITSCLLSFVLLFAGTIPAAAETELPAVARPTIDLGGTEHSGGTAFFVRVDSKVGHAAVGTAHGIDASHATCCTGRLRVRCRNRATTRKGKTTFAGTSSAYSTTCADRGGIV
jgi:hypothetical protein